VDWKADDVVCLDGQLACFDMMHCFIQGLKDMS